MGKTTKEVWGIFSKCKKPKCPYLEGVKNNYERWGDLVLAIQVANNVCHDPDKCGIIKERD